MGCMVVWPEIKIEVGCRPKSMPPRLCFDTADIMLRLIWRLGEGILIKLSAYYKAAYHIYFCNNKIYGLKKLIKLCDKEYMIIGRNNMDIKYYVEKGKDINNINYYTAHKSKGLESNDIILIN